jgi:hypothetical protein
MAKQNIFAKRAGHPDQQIARRANHPTVPFDPLRGNCEFSSRSAGRPVRKPRFFWLVDRDEQCPLSGPKLT